MKQIHIFTLFVTAKSFFDGQFNYLSGEGNDILLISSPDVEAQEFAEKNNIRFVPVEMPRALSPITIFKAILKLSKIISKEKPNAVFGHTPVGALCAMLASKMCGVRNRIYYRHGLIYTTMSGFKFSIFKCEEKIVSSLATGIINVSHSLSRLAIRDNLNSADKQYVIGHGTCGGIDATNLFNPKLLSATKIKDLRNKLGIEDSTIVYGFCGRICVDKGVPEMVDGFIKLKKTNCQISSKLILIGPLDTRDFLPSKTKQTIDNDEDIIVTGWIDKEDIQYYYSILDVFVFPSHREGFGMSVIEASAMEKPILVSHVHGCEDTIVEHVTGEYVDLTSDSIYRGMEQMLDSNLREKLGKQGRQIVLERFDQSVMWPQISNLYSRILK